MTEKLKEPYFITSSDGIRYPARRRDRASRDDLIIRLRNRGLSMPAIAAEAGCSVGTVSAVLKRAREAAA